MDHCTSKTIYTPKYQFRDAEPYSTFRKTHAHVYVPRVSKSSRRIVDETSVGGTDDNRLERFMHTTLLCSGTSRYCGFHRWYTAMCLDGWMAVSYTGHYAGSTNGSKFYKTKKTPASNTSMSSRHYQGVRSLRGERLWDLSPSSQNTLYKYTM